MRLIDADVLKQDLTRFYENEVTARQLIDEQPDFELPIMQKCTVCPHCDNCDVRDDGTIDPDPSDVARDIATIIENEKDMRVVAGPEPKWIPCSERLPEKDTRFYLTTIANRGLNFTTTLPDDVDVIRWDYDRRKGHNSWHWCTERTVIAWMPLPSPYREEGDNE